MLEIHTNNQLPQELKDVILSGKCVTFIGSGLSMDIYPSWHELVNSLCKGCGSNHRVTSDSIPKAFLDAAQGAKDCNKDKYFSILGEIFGRPADKASLTYDALLALPFDSYVTVNLDPLLALTGRRASLECSKDIKAFPSLDRRNMGNRTIHYLHGYIEENTVPADGTIVLADGEFDDAYDRSGNSMTFLLPMLENDPIVFIGCRLREPVMERVFPICKEHQLKRQDLSQSRNGSSKPPRRFILLPIPEVETEEGRKHCDQMQRQEQRERQQKEDNYYQDMDITPVWYQASGSDHSMLRFTLEHLAELKPPKADYGWNYN